MRCPGALLDSVPLLRYRCRMTGREGLRRWARRATRAWHGLGARVRPVEPIPYAAVDASGPADPIPPIIAAPEFAAATRWFAQEPGRSQLSPEAQALLFTLTRNLKPAHVFEIGTYLAGTSEAISRATRPAGASAATPATAPATACRSTRSARGFTTAI